MLCDTSCNREQTLEVDGVPVEFSLAKEGTKVSMHALHALLYLAYNLTVGRLWLLHTLQTISQSGKPFF